MSAARRVRAAGGSDAFWNRLRPAYWGAVSLLTRGRGVAMTLTDGGTYSLDARLFGWAPESFEPEVVRRLLALVRPDSIVYDVGAHVGLISMMSARRIGDGSGHVYAFEPSPDNFSALQRHLRANDLHRRVTSFNALVGERSEATVAFHYSPGQFTANSLAYQLPGSLSAWLPMFALDEVVAAGRAPAPSVIKIDVEGYEHAVLQGARQVLAAHGPAVICALHPEPLALLGTSTDRILADMRAWGYAAFSLDGAPVSSAGFEEVVFLRA